MPPYKPYFDWCNINNKLQNKTFKQKNALDLSSIVTEQVHRCVIQVKKAPNSKQRSFSFYLQFI